MSMVDLVVGGRAPAAEAPARRARPGRWRRRFAVAAYVAALGWLLLVVTHLLVSGRTWLWAPVDLMPPILLLAVPAALLALVPLARPYRWRMAVVLVAAGALGAGGSGLNPAALWHEPGPAPPDAITVVSWNTEFWDQAWRTGGRGYEPDFYRHLRGLDADVYLLKEYLYMDDAKPLAPEHARTIDRLGQVRNALPGYQVAVSGKQITVSRYPIVAQRGLDMRRWLPADLRVAPRSVADYPGYFSETFRTDLLVNGSVMSFYNVHVSQPAVDLRLHRAATREADRAAYHRQLASYRALRADVAANPNPVVVGADLNTSPAMGMLEELPDRLVDHSAALSSPYPWTWMVGGYPLWRIDWVLSTPDVAVHRYELLDPAGMSDHRVLRVSLSMRENAR